MRPAILLWIALSLPLAAEESWSKLILKGKHSGWTHEWSETLKDGDRDIVKNTEEGILRVAGPDGSEREIHWRTECTEDEKGTPVKFSYKTTVGEKTMETIQGEPDGKGMCFTISLADRQPVAVHAEGFLFPLGQRLLVKKQGFRPGTAYDYLEFSTDDNRIVTNHVEIIGDVKLPLDTGEVTAHRARRTQKSSSSSLEAQYDDEGNVLSLASKDAEMELIRSTREKATDLPAPGK